MASRSTNIINRLIQSGTVNVTTTASSVGSGGAGSANLTYGIDARPLQRVGTGLDDITCAITAYTTEKARDYGIIINTAAATDTFDWYEKVHNEGVGQVVWGRQANADPFAGWNLGATGVAMVGGAMTLSLGATITWAATTGHTAGDAWVFTARRPAINSQAVLTHFQNLSSGTTIYVAPTQAVTADAAATGGWQIAPGEVLSFNWSKPDLEHLFFIVDAGTARMRVFEETI